MFTDQELAVLATVAEEEEDAQTARLVAEVKRLRENMKPLAEDRARLAAENAAIRAAVNDAGEALERGKLLERVRELTRQVSDLETSYRKEHDRARDLENARAAALEALGGAFGKYVASGRTAREALLAVDDRKRCDGCTPPVVVCKIHGVVTDDYVKDGQKACRICGGEVTAP